MAGSNLSKSCYGLCTPWRSIWCLELFTSLYIDIKESKACGIDIYEDDEGKQYHSEPFELPKNYSRDKEKAKQYWNKAIELGDNRTKEYVNKKLKLLSD